jgi:hypothetical protein
MFVLPLLLFTVVSLCRRRRRFLPTVVLLPFRYVTKSDHQKEQASIESTRACVRVHETFKPRPLSRVDLRKKKRAQPHPHTHTQKNPKSGCGLSNDERRITDPLLRSTPRSRSCPSVVRGPSRRAGGWMDGWMAPSEFYPMWVRCVTLTHTTRHTHNGTSVAHSTIR